MLDKSKDKEIKSLIFQAGGQTRTSPPRYTKTLPVKRPRLSPCPTASPASPRGGHKWQPRAGPGPFQRSDHKDERRLANVDVSEPVISHFSPVFPSSPQLRAALPEPAIAHLIKYTHIPTELVFICNIVQRRKFKGKKIAFFFFLEFWCFKTNLDGVIRAG